uniref:Uncharacterized protein n=1 Tax=Rangifer tarandus platyrhynchus TaxID=3082113 RepID=A0ACB0EN15_RANTA|nr:unnamed protein product [Rangifer tarandus platyrhynchus]
MPKSPLRLPSMLGAEAVREPAHRAREGPTGRFCPKITSSCSVKELSSPPLSSPDKTTFLDVFSAALFLKQDTLALPMKRESESRAWRALWRPPGLFCRGDSHGGWPGVLSGRRAGPGASARPPGREPRESRERAADLGRCRSRCAALRGAFPCARCPRLPSGCLLRPLPAGGCASQSARHPDTPAVASRSHVPGVLSLQGRYESKIVDALYPPYCTDTLLRSPERSGQHPPVHPDSIQDRLGVKLAGKGFETKANRRLAAHREKALKQKQTEDSQRTAAGGSALRGPRCPVERKQLGGSLCWTARLPLSPFSSLGPAVTGCLLTELEGQEARTWGHFRGALGVWRPDLDENLMSGAAVVRGRVRLDLGSLGLPRRAAAARPAGLSTNGSEPRVCSSETYCEVCA